VPQLESYLHDRDARVRRAAIAVLTEAAPAGAGLALAAAVADGNGFVRHAAAAGLRELAAVLPGGDEELRDALRRCLVSPDPVARRAILDVLREVRAGDAVTFAAALADADYRVRLSAVHGLVSSGATRLMAQAAGDQSREVRIAVAEGLAILGGGTSGGADLRRVLELLADDGDPLVRAAAFKAVGAVGCPPPLDDIAARALAGPHADTAWQARAGAAQALAAARPEVAIAPLVSAVADPHPDVRKATVIALVPLSAYPAATDALRAAAADGDADVRAYARQGPG
jgi:HEAT repeat protein